MTETEAMSRGYSFTGHYSKDRDIMLEKAQLIRKQGDKAIVLPVLPRKLPKGGITLQPRQVGYVVYWKESIENKECRNRNQIKKLVERRFELLIEITNIDERLEDLREE